MDKEKEIIPYKKDLQLSSAEEIDKAEQKRKQEAMQDDIDSFLKGIAWNIKYFAKNKKQKFVLYDIEYIKHNYNKSTQNTILKAIQDDLTIKGYTNYITKIKLNGERLVILLDDSQRNKAEETIKQINKDNIKSALVATFTLLLGFASIMIMDYTLSY